MSTIAPVMPGRSPSVFRIAAWNCRRAMDRKRSAIAALDADVLVVAEARLGFKPDPGYTMLFKGSSPAMGLAVLVRSPFEMSVSPVDPGLPWLLPVDVWSGRSLVATVLAVWTVKHSGDGRPS